MNALSSMDPLLSSKGELFKISYNGKYFAYFKKEEKFSEIIHYDKSFCFDLEFSTNLDNFLKKNNLNLSIEYFGFSLGEDYNLLLNKYFSNNEVFPHKEKIYLRINKNLKRNKTPMDLTEENYFFLISLGDISSELNLFPKEFNDSKEILPYFLHFNKLIPISSLLIKIKNHETRKIIIKKSKSKFPEDYHYLLEHLDKDELIENSYESNIWIKFLIDNKSFNFEENTETLAFRPELFSDICHFIYKEGDFKNNSKIFYSSRHYVYAYGIFLKEAFGEFLPKPALRFLNKEVKRTKIYKKKKVMPLRPKKEIILSPEEEEMFEQIGREFGEKLDKLKTG